MVMTKLDVREKETSTGEITSPVARKMNRIVTVTSEEVIWLFGVEQTTLNAWVRHGVLTPCSSTPCRQRQIPPGRRR